MFKASARRLPKRIAATLLTTSLALGVSVVAAPTANASGCTYWDPRTNGEGGGTFKISTYLRQGEESACDYGAYASAGTKFYGWCWVLNQYGNVWWYGRLEGTDLYGWTAAANLNDLQIDDDGDGIYEPQYCWDSLG